MGMLVSPTRFRLSGYLLDALSLTAYEAYSLRRLRGGYAGYSVKVRRSSDNATQDIGFTTAGDLDIASIATFCGVGSGYVDTLYDQSGNGRNLTTSSNARQPLIYSAGSQVLLTGSKPGFSTDGTAQILEGGVGAVSQPLTRASVMKFLSVSSGSFFSDNIGNAMQINGAGTLAMYAATFLNFKTGVAANDVAAVTEVFNTSSSAGWYNGSKVGGNTGGYGPQRRSIGGAWDGTNRVSLSSATYSEHIIFASALSDPTAAALQANQKTYWGTP